MPELTGKDRLIADLLEKACELWLDEPAHDVVEDLDFTHHVRGALGAVLFRAHVRERRRREEQETQPVTT